MLCLRTPPSPMHSLSAIHVQGQCSSPLPLVACPSVARRRRIGRTPAVTILHCRRTLLLPSLPCSHSLQAADRAVYRHPGGIPRGAGRDPEGAPLDRTLCQQRLPHVAAHLAVLPAGDSVVRPLLLAAAGEGGFRWRGQAQDSLRLRAAQAQLLPMAAAAAALAQAAAAAALAQSAACPAACTCRHTSHPLAAVAAVLAQSRAALLPAPARVLEDRGREERQTALIELGLQVRTSTYGRCSPGKGGAA